MNDSIDILKKLALQVRNAASAGENTAERIGRILIGILESADIEKLKEFFLSATDDDEATGLIRFLKGLISEGLLQANGGAEFGQYTQGALGSGACVKIDPATGQSYIEVDKLYVRLKAIFDSLEIRHSTHIGGQEILTPAGMICIRVEEISNAYRCYMKTDDGDKAVFNLFALGDQAQCRETNVKEGIYENVSNQYYWRLVIGIGDDYIDLSKTDCDTGSMIPLVGDDIYQLGNRTDKSRQNAIVLSAVGPDAPSFKQYAEIDSYTLEGKRTSMLSPEFNELTGVLHIKNGSTGAGNLLDLPDEVAKAIDLGSVNILLNSGFTGQYEDENLDPETELSADSELYNKKLANWTGVATVSEEAQALSGYAVTLGSISQPIKLIISENYVVSYRAVGTNVTISCGNYSVSQPLTDVHARYIHKFKFTGNQLFLISGSALLYDLKLERGSIATDWSPSPLDNDKSMEEMKSLSYIQDAIRDGSIDMIGGLMLSNMIMTGNYKDGKMSQVTAGMSGIYNDDDDVAFWAGGTFEQAIRAVMYYKDNPTATPSEEELKLMSNLSITHGGRAILNDVIMRGYVYALGINVKEFGKIASSIFSKDCMFSQQGTDRDGNITEQYTKYGTPDFNPNLELDFKKGLLRTKQAELEGYLKGGFQSKHINVDVTKHSSLEIDLKKGSDYFLYVIGTTIDQFVKISTNKSYIGISLRISFAAIMGGGTVHLYTDGYFDFRWRVSIGHNIQIQAGGFLELVGVVGVGPGTGNNPSGIGSTCEWRIVNSGDFEEAKTTEGEIYFRSITRY